MQNQSININPEQYANLNLKQLLVMVLVSINLRK